MRSILFRILTIAAAAVLFPALARAQTPDTPGVVEGQAVAPGGAPVTFALVRLIPLAGGNARSTLTREDGGFRFTGVAPGPYRLRLERIGFQTDVSEPFTVETGGRVAHTFRGAPRAVRIEGVTGAAACYTGDQLARDAELANLWAEAQKGMETKRAFDREYIYSYSMTQRTRRDLVAPRQGTRVVHDTSRTHVVNDPRTPPREVEWQGFGRAKGVGLFLRVPDGKEILDPAFLAAHCLDSGFSEQDGAWEFDFRPVRPNPREFELRGTVRVDRETFQLRSMVLEYMKGAEPFLRATIEFRDARVPGGTLRLPVSIDFEGRPVGGAARAVRQVKGTVEYTEYVYFPTPADAVTGSAPRD